MPSGPATVPLNPLRSDLALFNQHASPYDDPDDDLPPRRPSAAPGFHPRIDEVICPLCRSPQVVPRERGKMAGAAIGTIAGASGGAASVLAGAAAGAEVGLLIGVVAGPPGIPVGTVTGAVIGALSGGIAGCAVGAALGEAVDESILRNRRCLSCGHTYSVPRH